MILLLTERTVSNLFTFGLNELQNVKLKPSMFSYERKDEHWQIRHYIFEVWVAIF